MSQLAPNDIAIPLRLRFNFLSQYNLVKYEVPPDGSCFFHSLLLSFDKNYRDQPDPIIRFATVVAIRKYIAERLPTYYHSLSRGTLAEYAKFVPEYELRNMMSKINSRSCVGLEVIELTSILFEVNILILDLNRADIYMTGDYSLLLKPEYNYVVLLYDHDRVHFELCGLKSSKGIGTYFNRNHQFVKSILNRIDELSK